MQRGSDVYTVCRAAEEGPKKILLVLAVSCSGLDVDAQTKLQGRMNCLFITASG
jgi:hypothetical protein